MVATGRVEWGVALGEERISGFAEGGGGEDRRMREPCIDGKADRTGRLAC